MTCSHYAVSRCSGKLVIPIKIRDTLRQYTCHWLYTTYNMYQNAIIKQNLHISIHLDKWFRRNYKHLQTYKKKQTTSIESIHTTYTHLLPVYVQTFKVSTVSTLRVLAKVSACPAEAATAARCCALKAPVKEEVEVACWGRWNLRGKLHQKDSRDWLISQIQGLYGKGLSIYDIHV